MSNLLISIFYGLMIGLALSVDAFMLALVFGSTFKKRGETILTSVLVGLFHFFMPITGYFIAKIVFSQINLTSLLENNIQYVAFIILILLGLMMIFKKENTDNFNICKLINKFLFAFSVSVDSFLTGIAFNTVQHIDIYLSCLLFALVSSSLTYLALNIGKNTAKRLIHSNLDLYAGLLMILLAILTLFI